MPFPERSTSLAAVVTTLRAHEHELREAGVVSLAVFGSVARGEADDGSDVDVLIRLGGEAAQGGFAYFGRLDALTRRLGEILGRPVDIVTEPVQKEQLRRNIERERALAF
jgi:predicted nucleotidyltransferase